MKLGVRGISSLEVSRFSQPARGGRSGDAAQRATNTPESELEAVKEPQNHLHPRYAGIKASIIASKANAGFAGKGRKILRNDTSTRQLEVGRSDEVSKYMFKPYSNSINKP